jgi:hypothetical protein
MIYRLNVGINDNEDAQFLPRNFSPQQHFFGLSWFRLHIFKEKNM